MVHYGSNFTRIRVAIPVFANLYSQENNSVIFEFRLQHVPKKRKTYLCYFTYRASTPNIQLLPQYICSQMVIIHVCWFHRRGILHRSENYAIIHQRGENRSRHLRDAQIHTSSQDVWRSRPRRDSRSPPGLFWNEVNNFHRAELQEWRVQRGLISQQPLSLAWKSGVTDTKMTPAWMQRSRALAKTIGSFQSTSIK